MQKSQVESALSKIPFSIIMAQPAWFLMNMGPMALIQSEAVYIQSIDALSGRTVEGIAFNAIFFGRMSIDNPRFLRVLFHELAHSTGHDTRLNRSGVQVGPKSGRERALEELIAERTSQKMMVHFGIQDAATVQSSNEYIQTYLTLFEKNEGGLSEFEAHVVETQSDKALDYMLQNWFNEVDTMRKAA